METLSSKPFKILAIDGGGIKGLYSSTILEQFEAKYNCRASDHFDLLCGTSTGGLIALGLSLRKPAAQLSELYINHGGIIFPGMNRVVKLFRQLFWRGIYTDRGLRKALQAVFGEHTLGDSRNLLCIPSFCLTMFQPVVFKRDYGHLYRHSKLRYVDVALATTAAPTFLPMAELEEYQNRQLVDGGLWANNPSLVGLTEALINFVGPGKPYQRIQLLSIASLSERKGNQLGQRRSRAFVDWGGEMLETAMTGQSFFADFFLSRLAEANAFPIDYLRIPSALLSTEQEKVIGLDKTGPKSIQLMRALGEETAARFISQPLVQQFFSSPKTFYFNHG